MVNADIRCRNSIVASMVAAILVALLILFSSKNNNIEVAGLIKERSLGPISPLFADPKTVAFRLPGAPTVVENGVRLSTPDCLKARSDSVPASLFQNLPKPFINLGFPKMGTTTIHNYFKCGRVRSTHWLCGRKLKCAECIKESVQSGLPPLSLCEHADVFAQLDVNYYFPQIELLEEFVHAYPNATFFLTFRDMEKWYQSISAEPKWSSGPFLDELIKKSDITGSPSNEGRSNPEEFSDWYCKHVQRVRNIVAQNPSHTLVEIDIEDPWTPERMEDIFGIKKSCWGHKNGNQNLHPELDQSGIQKMKDLRRNHKFQRMKREGSV
ncbi:hypothetical protein ACHAXR_009046 [Thalassiosira sp. AJA248-18]